MKTSILTALLFLGTFAQAAALTRPVTVVEGTKTESYLGTQFGQTLYTFDLDTAGTSACTNLCVEKWPPLLVSQPEAKALVAPFGVINRAGGTQQVTYHGKPVYTFFLDHAEGDNKGDNVGNLWHSVDL